MKINKIIVSSFLLLLLVFTIGCANKSFKSDSVKTNYVCQNGLEFTTEIHKSQGIDQVILIVGGNYYPLDITPSGSGEKYTDGMNTLWIKGNDALLELANDSQELMCQVAE